MTPEELIKYDSDLDILKRYFEGHTRSEVGEIEFINNTTIPDARTSIRFLGSSTQNNISYSVIEYKAKKYTVSRQDGENWTTYVLVEKLVPIDVTEAVPLRLADTIEIDIDEFYIRDVLLNGYLLEGFTAQISNTNFATVDGDILEGHVYGTTEITLRGKQSGKTKTFTLEVKYAYENPIEPPTHENI